MVVPPVFHVLTPAQLIAVVVGTSVGTVLLIVQKSVMPLVDRRGVFSVPEQEDACVVGE